jgi:hypothetical protein
MGCERAGRLALVQQADEQAGLEPQLRLEPDDPPERAGIG